MRDMAAAEIQEFLAAGTRTGKVATVSRKGRPHVAPLWFVVDGDDLVFITSASSAKGKHLRANPQACLVVDDDVFPFAFAMVSGPVTVVEEASDRWPGRSASPPDTCRRTESRSSGPATTRRVSCWSHIREVIAQADLAG